MTFLSSLKRRDFLKIGGAGMALPVFGALSTQVVAQANTKPEDRSGEQDLVQQAPGFFRFSLGETKITILSDGSLTLPTSSLAVNVPEAQVKAFLKANYRNREKHYSHTNACLIDTGDERILVDVGSGPSFQQSAGRLLKNLAASGYKPDDITSVVITHAHPDHVWGILDPKTEQPHFENANYYIAAAEWDYWTQEDLTTQLPKAMHQMVPNIQKNLLGIAEKAKRIKPGDEIAPGITALDTSGHTPGHISVQIIPDGEGAGQAPIVVTGDVLLHSFISFEQPTWQFGFDMDPNKAAKTRQSLLEQSVAEETYIIGFHLPFPGVGRVAKSGQAFRWVPEVWRW